MSKLHAVLKRYYEDPSAENASFAINRLREDRQYLRAFLRQLRNSIHACNRNPIPNSRRVEWRDRIDEALEE